MKKSFLFFLSLFLMLPAALLWAQYPVRVIEQTYRLPAGKRVALNLKFARQIQVRTWDRDELGLKVSIMRSNPELDRIHRLEVQEGGEQLRVETDFQFPESEKENGRYTCWNCDPGKAADRDGCICFQVSYEVLLPADADLSLETISGDIEVRGLRGPLFAKSISGFLDVGLPARAASDLSFRSVTGEIYTDFDIALDRGSTTYSKRLHAPLNGGGPRIALETVSGDIFFRKN